MTKVIADMTMSLDGFVADPHGGVEHLFDWYFKGDVTVPSRKEELTFRVSEASVPHLRAGFEHVGCLVVGRRLYDITDGWGGLHPMGVPVVVLSHSVPDEPRWPFVTDGVARAVELAKETAGPDRWVGIAGASIARQCLDLGLLDEIRVALVPVLLGAGIPWFAGLGSAPVLLENPEIVAGDRVTHLYYKVRRDA